MTQEEMRLDGLFLIFFHVIHASFLKYKFNDIEFYSVINYVTKQLVLVILIILDMNCNRTCT